MIEKNKYLCLKWYNFLNKKYIFFIEKESFGMLKLAVNLILGGFL